MPKRPCPHDDIIQPIKRQQNSKLKSRKIRSSSSERTLQLLYKGASKCENLPEAKKEGPKMECFRCLASVTARMICNYCERDICPQCINFCYKCNNGFCCNCSFPTYDHNDAVCYSCYV